MFKVKTKIAGSTTEAQNYEVKKEKTGFQLNNQAFEWDLVKVNAQSFHIIRNHQSFRAEIIKADYETKTFVIQINDNRYEMVLEDRFDLLLKQMGMDKIGSAKVSEIKAPMPGLILEVKVIENQEVKKGDALLILEAMKMENVLKSPIDGIIKTIKVQKGDNVEKNHVLIQFT